MDIRPIGIFDSGVGGLGITKEIINLLPNENIIYYCDNANNPYGLKSETQITNFALNIVSLLSRANCKLVVIACNTATVTALDEIRARFKLPIVGVVPVIKTASAETKTNNIGILATSVTIRSTYLEYLIQTFAPQKRTLKIPNDKLVAKIEQFRVDDKSLYDDFNVLKGCVSAHNIDVLAIGCTHFTLIKDRMHDFFEGKLRIMDSNDAVARQVKRVLTLNNNLNTYKNSYRYFINSGRNYFLKLWLEKISIKGKVISATEWEKYKSFLDDLYVYFKEKLPSGPHKMA